MREIREKGKKSQKQFAKLCDISLSKYQRLEKGLTAPDVNILLKILKEYPKENPTWLLLGDNMYKKHSISSSGVDGELFAKVISAVESQLSKDQILIGKIQKADMMSLLYEHCILLKMVGGGGEQIDQTLVKRYIALMTYPEDFSTEDH